MKPAWWLLLLAACVLSFGRSAGAHEFRPATLMLAEVSPGRFAVAYAPPAALYETGDLGRPEFPNVCRAEPGWLDCGANGLVGAIRFPGLSDTTQRVVVQIHWLGGKSSTHVVSADGELVVNGAHSTLSALLPVAGQYVRLGVEHICTGVDHLLFVLGLLLIVRRRGHLVWTVTAFSLAHSITLAAALLGAVSLPPPPVEAAIALSILLLATECASATPTLVGRKPWLVAFGFGLLHGFGFAGALKEIGLPPHQTGLALLSFNAGVELGQLAVVVLAWNVVARLARRGRNLALAERLLVLALGTLATYWTWERGLALFGVGLV